MDKDKDKKEEVVSGSTLDILRGFNMAGNTETISQAFKDKLNNGTIGPELSAAIFFKIKNIVLNSPCVTKITEQQSAAYFHEIRGLFSILEITK